MACACWHGINRSGATAGVCDGCSRRSHKVSNCGAATGKSQPMHPCCGRCAGYKPLVGVAG